MKVVRPRETITTLNPTDLIKYALSLKDPDVIVSGMDSIEIVKANLEILRSFKPLSQEKMEVLAQELTPLYNHENLPWMKPWYCDGNWVWNIFQKFKNQQITTILLWVNLQLSD